MLDVTAAPESHAGSELRSCLFIDFENIDRALAGLRDHAAQDREARELWGAARDWLDALTARALPHGSFGSRRFLARRAYIPIGGVTDQERRRRTDAARELGRAGFEVIRPQLLAHTKNAADIELILDAYDFVLTNPKVDEVIVMSADADFAPLLRRLSARDIRTTIVHASDLSREYASVADRVVPLADLRSVRPPASPPIVPPPQVPPPPPRPQEPIADDRVITEPAPEPCTESEHRAAVLGALRNEREGMSLQRLGTAVRAILQARGQGHVPRAYWGCQGLKDWIRRRAADVVRVVEDARGMHFASLVGSEPSIGASPPVVSTSRWTAPTVAEDTWEEDDDEQDEDNDEEPDEDDDLVAEPWEEDDDTEETEDTDEFATVASFEADPDDAAKLLLEGADLPEGTPFAWECVLEIVRETMGAQPVEQWHLRLVREYREQTRETRFRSGPRATGFTTFDLDTIAQFFWRSLPDDISTYPRGADALVAAVSWKLGVPLSEDEADALRQYVDPGHSWV